MSIETRLAPLEPFHHPIMDALHEQINGAIFTLDIDQLRQTENVFTLRTLRESQQVVVRTVDDTTFIIALHEQNTPLALYSIEKSGTYQTETFELTPKDTKCQSCGGDLQIIETDAKEQLTIPCGYCSTHNHAIQKTIPHDNHIYFADNQPLTKSWEIPSNDSQENDEKPTNFGVLFSSILKRDLVKAGEVLIHRQEYQFVDLPVDLQELLLAVEAPDDMEFSIWQMPKITDPTMLTQYAIQAGSDRNHYDFTLPLEGYTEHPQKNQPPSPVIHEEKPAHLIHPKGMELHVNDLFFEAPQLQEGMTQTFESLNDHVYRATIHSNNDELVYYLVTENDNPTTFVIPFASLKNRIWQLLLDAPKTRKSTDKIDVFTAIEYESAVYHGIIGDVSMTNPSLHMQIAQSIRNENITPWGAALIKRGEKVSDQLYLVIQMEDTSLERFTFAKISTPHVIK